MAVGAITIRSGKTKNLVPAAVVGKLLSHYLLYFSLKVYACGTDIYIVPLMCVICVAVPFVLVTIAPRFITAAEVNLFFLLETIIVDLGLVFHKRTAKHRNAYRRYYYNYNYRSSFISKTKTLNLSQLRLDLIIDRKITAIL